MSRTLHYFSFLYHFSPTSKQRSRSGSPKEKVRLRGSGQILWDWDSRAFYCVVSPGGTIWLIERYVWCLLTGCCGTGHAILFTKQILIALDVVHAANVMHRDLTTRCVDCGLAMPFSTFFLYIFLQIAQAFAFLKLGCSQYKT